ncbi:MAG: DUF4296 domain-containing protein [Bacteroidetes bacterium]|nr:DUF4296 domain-containing protein [Bacteroidota bacterium]
MTGLRNLWQKLIVVFSLFIFSCSQKTSETPANLIPRETFVNVLVDFALAESAANMNIKNVAFNKTDSVYNFNPLEENNVTKAQYDSALLFYSAHTELYKEIYQDVLVRLNAMQTQRDSLKNKK